MLLHSDMYVISLVNTVLGGLLTHNGIKMCFSTVTIYLEQIVVNYKHLPAIIREALRSKLILTVTSK